MCGRLENGFGLAGLEKELIKQDIPLGQNIESENERRYLEEHEVGKWQGKGRRNEKRVSESKRIDGRERERTQWGKDIHVS